jgi:hypothetical protein
VKRVSKLHLGDFGKAFSLAFVLISVLWGMLSHFSLGGIYITWHVLLINLTVAGILAGITYRIRYHRVLEYDDSEFTLRVGYRVVKGEWRDYSFVSLYHKGFGTLAVRLYKGSPDEMNFVELPAADLGLDASEFRFELAAYLLGG